MTADNALAYQGNLKLVFDRVNDAVITTTLDSRITSWNRGAEKIFGWQEKDAIGKSASELLLPEYRVGEREAAVQDQLEKGFWEGESRLHRKDGSQLTLLTSATVLKDPLDNPVGLALIYHDVSEQKKSEEALKESQERFAQAFQFVATASAITNIDDGRIIDVNEAFQRLYGYQRDELLGRKTPEIDIWADPQKRQEIIRKLLVEGKVRDQDVTTRAKDGRLIDTIFSMEIISLGGKKFALSSALDVTERRKAVAALRASEEQFRVIFERSTVGKSITLPDGTIVQVNQAFADMIGYTIPEMKLNFTQITHPDDIAISRECVRSLLSGERSTYRFEKRYLHRNGSPVWADVNAAISRDSHGIPLYFITSVLNITERKKAEAALYKSEEKYRTLFSSMAEGFGLHEIILDSEGKPSDYRFLELNDAFEKLTGLSRDKVVGRTIKEILPNIDPYWIETYGKVALTKEPVQFENYSTPLDKWYQAYAYSPGENRFAVVFADITARKKTEEQLQRYTAELETANRELETANSELAALNYAVSHDLRQPLRALESFSEVLLEDYRGRLDIPGKDYLDRIRKASQYMSEITDDIVKLTRVNREDLFRDKVDLSHIARSIAEEPRAGQPERSAEFRIAPDMLITGDRSLLSIALRNLLENAWKFSGQCPQTWIEMGIFEKDSAKVYFIQDNGIGFNMKYAGRLFQPFHSLHSNRDYPGTGIGLAIVRRIIHRHGGKIWVESEKDKGTTFYFTLGE